MVEYMCISLIVVNEMTKDFKRCTSQLLEFLWMAGAKEGVENDDGVTPLRTVIRFNSKPMMTNLQ